MRRLVVTIEYDGTDFLGWQLQAEGRTVQGVLENALRKATQEAIRPVGAGRTDAGVHAEGQVAHFDTRSRLRELQMTMALNYWLPSDVAVLSCHEAPPAFHAQFSAASKLYRYRILPSRTPRPLRERHVRRIVHPLDPGPMAECARMLEGEHDFTSFASEHCEAATRVRRVLRSELAVAGDELHYLVGGEGFLYNMVRIIVGTLVEVGRGKMTVDDFAAALRARDRCAAGPTAAAKGLTLVRVNYENDPRSDGGSALP